MGPGGECEPDAVADGNCVSAFGDDAGETRNDEERECVADLLDLHANDPGDLIDAIWGREFSTCVCPELDWRLVLWIHSDRVCCLPVYVLQAEGPFEDREQIGRTGEPGVELPVQQSDFAGRLFHSLVGNAVSCF